MKCACQCDVRRTAVMIAQRDKAKNTSATVSLLLHIVIGTKWHLIYFCSFLLIALLCSLRGLFAHSI